MRAKKTTSAKSASSFAPTSTYTSPLAMSKLCSRCDELFNAAFEIVTAPTTRETRAVYDDRRSHSQVVFEQTTWSWDEWKLSVNSSSCDFCTFLYCHLWGWDASSIHGNIYLEFCCDPEDKTPMGYTQTRLNFWTSKLSDERRPQARFHYNRLIKHDVIFRVDHIYNGK